MGARSDKEWFLKEIEITNLATSVSWTCEFNCWLPKHDGHEYHEAEPRTKPKPGLSFDNLSGRRKFQSPEAVESENQVL